MKEIEYGVDDNYEEDVLENLKNPDLAKIYFRQVVEEDSVESMTEAMERLQKSGNEKIVHEVMKEHLQKIVSFIDKILARKAQVNRIQANRHRYFTYYAQMMSLERNPVLQESNEVVPH
jgi:hypothetical protein